LTSDGFFERSIHNEIEQFGNIVQVWSTYESRHNLDDAKPFARGINSFQLLKDGDRYWVVNIFWDSESPAKPIPATYLPYFFGRGRGAFLQGFLGKWACRLWCFCGEVVVNCVVNVVL
jgi:hypothetical protein